MKDMNATTFRSLEIGARFKIINTNFDPPKTMDTIFMKLTESTYSYARRNRVDAVDRLRSDSDDFRVEALS